MNQAASDVRNCETQKTVIFIYVCHCVGRKNPIRRVKTELQMATVVSLWLVDVGCSRDMNFIVKLTCLNQIKSFTVCLTCTIKPESFNATLRPHKPP